MPITRSVNRGQYHRFGTEFGGLSADGGLDKGARNGQGGGKGTVVHTFFAVIEHGLEAFQQCRQGKTVPIMRPDQPE